MTPRRTVLGGLAALAFNPARAALDAVQPEADWQRLTPAQSGWNAGVLAQADTVLRDIGGDALLVVHRGSIVHATGPIEKPMNLYSVRKSVLSMLFGMHTGQIDLDATLAKLGIDDKQKLSDAEKQATVRHLLQARSGVYHPAAYETPEMVRDRPIRGSHAPGTFWYYNNWDFNTLATVFQRTVGKDVFQGLTDDFAEPLGFQDFDRARDTQWERVMASEHPAYVMALSARDLARLGLLMARSGRWDQRPYMPSDWVIASTQSYTRVGAGWQGYGYMWWVPQRAWPFWQRAPGQVFFAEGNHGQYLFVDRGRDLVIVHRTEGPRLLRRLIDAERISPLLDTLLKAMPA